jgi:hypothetical protein
MDERLSRRGFLESAAAALGVSGAAALGGAAEDGDDEAAVRSPDESCEHVYDAGGRLVAQGGRFRTTFIYYSS